MTLIWILAIPFFAGLLAWATARLNDSSPRWISLAASVASLALTLQAWWARAPGARWAAEYNAPWIPEFGISFRLGMDGLSFLLLALTFFLTAIGVFASWTEIQESVGFFHLNLMWISAAIAAVFVALDLFLFFFAWEAMLIPMYFLISIWGYERRVYAAIKFFIFTQFSGLLMLVAILALCFAHAHATGVITFDYLTLLSDPRSNTQSLWITLGFFIAFAVKLPMVPFHTWLPDAHTEAPTAGSIILAGLMLKTGGYGLMRFVVPLFPDASRTLAPLAIALGVAGVIYGAILAFGQTDLKRLIAYTSVSHLGFVLMGVFAFNELALKGAVITMLAHGLSTGALFFVVGALQHRIHSREFGRMGGIWNVTPRLSGAALFFVMASLGLPGLADFVGEFLTLAGTWQATPTAAAVASLGVVGATIYGLKVVQRVLYGPNVNNLAFADFSPREAFIAACFVAASLWIGLYPAPVLSALSTSAEPFSVITSITRSFR
ncbi:MAG: NADH-quinone oxidoreductase subunit M [Acidobacteria bacterium]|nr:NADH-quinone oxidoreductase subunit M [Acidobacteriota bacterium]